MKSFRLDPPKSLSAKVMLRLRQAIIEGELALGAIIAEETLAQSFGVSRTPVREALNQLQLQGLVTIRPQVGSFVFRPSPEDISELCEFRSVIEPRAAELAFRHDRDGTIAAMAAAIADMEKALEKRDNVAYGRADTALHEALFAHCGNSYIEESYRLAAGKIAALRTNLSSPIDVQNPTSYEEHRSFLRFFEAGDFAAFERLMVAHVTASGRTYVKVLEERAGRL
ncbi:DNA-binding GntR family transcriptional regulator [Chelatococcus caeni]|uniref:DNA-binding GntR family transcriptional regulator n=1 Tax=Chelatococcus caeni TaxID=1348468 RepID=A0A840C362_9HYPH|nr:GntR family transcriptional regulator [Chelatococcus caeni]MBB4018442.1 DNA-binding GntR family transcriptional regulator [Chelatococcus caeni]